ncbi:chorismate mutase [Sphingobium sp. TKS]|uniref:chorismate mutase n=1 Tax=Sphingobium sp. TKS TaxID=1315974 RepID=UPI00076FE805|nr:chorismate mutase [Sphingobium sp. TKS]AMK24159.1 chorismate mutase [Sphingobium sp. TKS]
MEDVKSRIEEIRLEIEAIDRELVPLIAKRIKLNGTLAPLKMAAGLEPHIPHRVKLVVERWMNLAVDQGINPELVRTLCEQIVAEGEKSQAEEMKILASK